MTRDFQEVIIILNRFWECYCFSPEKWTTRLWLIKTALLNGLNHFSYLRLDSFIYVQYQYHYSRDFVFLFDYWIFTSFIFYSPEVRTIYVILGQEKKGKNLKHIQEIILTIIIKWYLREVTLQILYNCSIINPKPPSIHSNQIFVCPHKASILISLIKEVRVCIWYYYMLFWWYKSTYILFL